jgi:hypothetical protein
MRVSNLNYFPPEFANPKFLLISSPCFYFDSDQKARVFFNLNQINEKYPIKRLLA